MPSRGRTLKLLQKLIALFNFSIIRGRYRLLRKARGAILGTNYDDCMYILLIEMTYESLAYSLMLVSHLNLS